MTDSAPLIEHLLELRTRILRALVAVLIVFLALISFANQIYDALAEPLTTSLVEGASMIATDVISPFLAPLKFTFFLSVMLAMPYLLYQAWAFVAPGLYENEKSVAFPILFSSVILFYAGITFAYFIVIPTVAQFIVNIAPESIAVMTDINAYLNFVIKLFFAFGLAFEIPIATFLVVKAGVTTAESLAAKRPYVIVGCFVVGMFLTPPDVFSQLFLAGPMWILFELGLLFAKTIKASNSEAGAKPEDKQADDKQSDKQGHKQKEPS